MLDKLQKMVAEIATAYALTRDFVRTVGERAIEALMAWIARATAGFVSELDSSANGSQRDITVVTAGLLLLRRDGLKARSTGLSWFGRARLDLLRKGAPTLT